jgi:hypothetical protein
MSISALCLLPVRPTTRNCRRSAARRDGWWSNARAKRQPTHPIRGVCSIIRSAPTLRQCRHSWRQARLPHQRLHPSHLSRIWVPLGRLSNGSSGSKPQPCGPSGERSVSSATRKMQPGTRSASTSYAPCSLAHGQALLEGKQRLPSVPITTAGVCAGSSAASSWRAADAKIMPGGWRANSSANSWHRVHRSGPGLPSW